LEEGTVAGGGGGHGDALAGGLATRAGLSAGRGGERKGTDDRYDDGQNGTTTTHREIHGQPPWVSALSARHDDVRAPVQYATGRGKRDTPDSRFGEVRASFVARWGQTRAKKKNASDWRRLLMLIEVF
jgi:hypothetical protein